MKVKIRFTDGTNSIIEDVYEVSAKPDDFFVRVFHPEGSIMINRNHIALMEVINEEDKNE